MRIAIRRLCLGKLFSRPGVPIGHEGERALQRWLVPRNCQVGFPHVVFSSRSREIIFITESELASHVK
jgi:hypothetical protein